MDVQEIAIANPCGKSWREMTPAAGGRFCGDCRKVVRDLSSLNEAEARALLHDRGGDLCVRYVYDARGHVVFRQQARLLTPSMLHRAKRAPAIALAMLPALAGCALTNGSDARNSEAMGGMPWIESPQPLERQSDVDSGRGAADAATARDAGPTTTGDAAPLDAPEAEDGGSPQGDAGADASNL